MNRRQFTLLLGASLTQMALSAKSAKANDILSENKIKLNKIRRFWFENTGKDPQEYLSANNVNHENFKDINQNELNDENILKFEGVYYSHCELALIASLAQIAELS